MNKEAKIQIIIISILSIILILLISTTIKMMNANRGMFGNKPFEEQTEKETSKDDIENGENIISENIKLDDYDTNVTINKGGIYNISGSFNHSILVDSSESVTLNLNNVNINSDITAAIANKGTGKMIINIVKGTTNILKDSGYSEFDGCIYSSGSLVIEGSGILKVYGNQDEGEGIATTDADITINGGEIYIESNDDGLNAGGDNGGIITINNGNITIKANGDGIDSNGSLIINGGNVYTIGSSKGGDAGIDTDKSFEINGGTVIALGSDMIQNPDNSSKQKYVSFSLKEKINNNSKISLKQGSTEIINFTANEDFKTLIVSNSKITNGTYDLYVDGNKTSFSSKVK